MPCTAKKLFEVAAAADITLIVQVKDNQPTVRQKVQQICPTTAPLGLDGSRNKGRNRDERRILAIFEPVSALLDTD